MLVYPIAYTCLTLPLASYRMASQSGNEPSQSILIFAGSFMASCGWVDVLIYLATRRTILTLQNSSLASADRSKNGDINGIPMNNTISGSQIRNSVRPNMATSVASSQEGFVKMEHVVEVTVESAIPIEQVITGEEGEEQHQQKPMGNSTTVSGTHYWA